jgi:SNF2 family DNA or RNA helicase
MYKVWPDEIKKWSDFNDISYTIVHGKDKAYNARAQADIHLINPEGLPWLIKNGNISQYDILVVDESSKFKDSQTLRFKALKPFLPGFKRRWILTGTPAPNGLTDLFGQIYILDLGRSLGRFVTHFRREFFDQNPYNVYEMVQKPDAWRIVTDRISPLVLQLSAEDYLQMPEIVNVTNKVALPTTIRKLYDQLENDFITTWNAGAIVAANAAVAGGKLRQVANGAIYREDHSYEILHDEKLDALESLLEEFGGNPCIIAYEFNHDRERIISRLGESIPVLGSGLSAKRLDEIIDGFNAGHIPILLGHPASMGHGLNLQGACNRIVWFGIPWNLEYYDQTIARIYRQGQKNQHIFVYHIVAEKTKDEDVIKSLTNKDHTQQSFLQALHRHREENFE